MTPGVRCCRQSRIKYIQQQIYCMFLILAANKGHCFAPTTTRNPAVVVVVPQAVVALSSSRCGLPRRRAASWHPLFMASSAASSSSSSRTMIIPSWSDLQSEVGSTTVGTALNAEVALRKMGQGSAHVHNTLRRFAPTLSSQEGSSTTTPAITVYRDHAGWCVIVVVCLFSAI